MCRTDSPQSVSTALTNSDAQPQGGGSRCVCAFGQRSGTEHCLARALRSTQDTSQVEFAVIKHWSEHFLHRGSFFSLPPPASLTQRQRCLVFARQWSSVGGLEFGASRFVPRRSMTTSPLAWRITHNFLATGCVWFPPVVRTVTAL